MTSLANSNIVAVIGTSERPCGLAKLKKFISPSSSMLMLATAGKWEHFGDCSHSFICKTLNAVSLTADSAVGSNAFGGRNLDHVEKADIEAGQILTALKSSPSPIRLQIPATLNHLPLYSITSCHTQSPPKCNATILGIGRIYSPACNPAVCIAHITSCIFPGYSRLYGVDNKEGLHLA